jgi:hypothetical protein
MVQHVFVILSSCQYMGVSENSVPLNPMVLLFIIPIKWLFHWEYTLFSDKPIWVLNNSDSNGTKSQFHANHHGVGVASADAVWAVARAVDPTTRAS